MYNDQRRVGELRGNDEDGGQRGVNGGDQDLRPHDPFETGVEKAEAFDDLVTNGGIEIRAWLIHREPWIKKETGGYDDGQENQDDLAGGEFKECSPIAELFTHRVECHRLQAVEIVEGQFHVPFLGQLDDAWNGSLRNAGQSCEHLRDKERRSITDGGHHPDEKEDRQRFTSTKPQLFEGKVGEKNCQKRKTEPQPIEQHENQNHYDEGHAHRLQHDQMLKPAGGPWQCVS